MNPETPEQGFRVAKAFTRYMNVGGRFPVNTTRRLFRMKSGKRYAEAMKNVDRAALYDIADASLM